MIRGLAWYILMVIVFTALALYIAIKLIEGNVI